VQHQLIRIATQGITGFDAPVSFAVLRETSAALTGIRVFCVAYSGPGLVKGAIDDKLDQSIGYLAQNSDFNSIRCR
jgi:cytochrome c peroxidase